MEIIKYVPFILSGLTVLSCGFLLCFSYIEKRDSEIVKKQAREFEKFSEMERN